MNARYRLLIVDDDDELTQMLGEIFAQHYSITVCHEGLAALQLLASQPFDLLVLDVMLPGLDGFTLLQRLRRTSRLPVIMLTAMSEQRDRIQGLDMGADDYLCKPFSPFELRSRIEAVLRRTAGSQQSLPVLELGNLRVSPGSQDAWIGERGLQLTAAEMRILELLMRAPGSAVTREQLSREALWRPLAPHDRSLDTHVSNLRRKLGSEPGVPRILSVRAAGYLLTVEDCP